MAIIRTPKRRRKDSSILNTAPEEKIKVEPAKKTAPVAESKIFAAVQSVAKHVTIMRTLCAIGAYMFFFVLPGWQIENSRAYDYSMKHVSNKSAPIPATIKPAPIVVSSLADVPVFKNAKDGSKSAVLMTIPADATVSVEGAIVSTGWRQVSFMCTTGKHKGQIVRGFIQQSDTKETLPVWPYVSAVKSGDFDKNCTSNGGDRPGSKKPQSTLPAPTGQK